MKKNKVLCSWHTQIRMWNSVGSFKNRICSVWICSLGILKLKKQICYLQEVLQREAKLLPTIARVTGVNLVFNTFYFFFYLFNETILQLLLLKCRNTTVFMCSLWNIFVCLAKLGINSLASALLSQRWMFRQASVGEIDSYSIRNEDLNYICTLNIG